MALSGDPALGQELQAILVTINSLISDSRDAQKNLKEYLRRREIDLLICFFREHQELPIPPEIKTEINAVAGGVNRNKIMAEAIRAKQRGKSSRGMSPGSAIVLDS